MRLASSGTESGLQARFATFFAIWGLLNISLPWQIHAQEETVIISWRECSKKSVQQGRYCLLGPVGPRGFIPKGDSFVFDARNVHGVCEQGKMARTPLADFFNILMWPIVAECFSGIPKLEGQIFMLEGHEI